MTDRPILDFMKSFAHWHHLGLRTRTLRHSEEIRLSLRRKREMAKLGKILFLGLLIALVYCLFKYDYLPERIRAHKSLLGYVLAAIITVSLVSTWLRRLFRVVSDSRTWGNDVIKTASADLVAEPPDLARTPNELLIPDEVGSVECEMHCNMLTFASQSICSTAVRPLRCIVSDFTLPSWFLSLQFHTHDARSAS